MASSRPLKCARLSHIQDGVRTSVGACGGEMTVVREFEVPGLAGPWPEFVYHDESIDAAMLRFVGHVARVQHATSMYLANDFGIGQFVIDMYLWVVRHLVAESGTCGRSWFHNNPPLGRSWITYGVFHRELVMAKDYDLTTLYACRQFMVWYNTGHPRVRTKTVLNHLFKRVFNFVAGARWLEHSSMKDLENGYNYVIYENMFSVHDIDILIARYDLDEDTPWSARFLVSSLRFLQYATGSGLAYDYISWRKNKFRNFHVADDVCRVLQTVASWSAHQQMGNELFFSTQAEQNMSIGTRLARRRNDGSYEVEPLLEISPAGLSSENMRFASHEVWVTKVAEEGIYFVEDSGVEENFMPYEHMKTGYRRFRSQDSCQLTELALRYSKAWQLDLAEDMDVWRNTLPERGWRLEPKAMVVEWWPIIADSLPSLCMRHNVVALDVAQGRSWMSSLSDFSGDCKMQFLLHLLPSVDKHGETHNSAVHRMGQSSMFERNVIRMIFSFVDPRCTSFTTA